MKILKVVLQNINSLKSDSPIVIDFEHEQFKDVGLYAITGPTGAGKTTILDAITIALYHNVPRFNGTKGSLIDVVSHGASDAFSSVIFENDGVVYEAFWSIRVADKNGKKYKNPKEEVSLKNLTTGAILASQKRNLIAEITQVTQLDYNQFLRSVMLAQGEFASFLSAKGPEKGKLLEQITGEQIYKKIGQEILNRKSNEDNKLREIHAKINSDDVLTEEEKSELSKNDSTFDVEIAKSEKEIIATQLIVDWYVQDEVLINKSEKLDQEAEEVELNSEKHKPELALLDLNDKAEPFKELIQNLNRTAKNNLEKTNQLKTLESQLAELKPALKKAVAFSKSKAAELGIAEKEFAAWLPNFDLITTLDGQLKNEAENKNKAEQNGAELLSKIEVLKEVQNQLANQLTETKSKLKIDEAFVSKNGFLKEVDAEISNWTSALTTLKSNKEILITDSKFISQKNKEVEETTLNLEENKELLAKKTAKVKLIEKEVTAVTVALTKNRLTDLLAQKETLTEQASNWNQFKNLAEQTVKAENRQSELLANKKSLTTDLDAAIKQLIGLKTQIEKQEVAVADADKILALEKSISKYEADRQNLEKGESCGLCGSKDHPFTEHLTSIGISKSEFELNQRKEKLQTLIGSKGELDKKEVKLTTSLENTIAQIESIKETIKSLQAGAKELDITCELTNLPKIEIQFNLVAEQIKLLDERLKVTEALQTNKDKLSKSIQAENGFVNSINTALATFDEKIKNSKSEIVIKQKSIDSLTKTCTSLESDLKTKLSKFNYELPLVADTNIFIQAIEKSISNFNEKQKNLAALKGSVTVVQTKIDHNKKQLSTDSKTQSDAAKTSSNCKKKIAQLKNERIAILPIDITVESKRESLQDEKNQLTDKVELSKTALQKLLDSKTEKAALKTKNEKDQKQLIQELNALNSTFDFQLKTSDFESKQAIETALLTKEDRVKYTDNKARIKEGFLRIKTLKDANLKAVTDLNKAKNFEASEVEVKSALEDLNTKKKTFLTEKGKIVEALRKDQEIRDRNQEVSNKIDAQTEVCNIWKELFKLIGNSKDAFNVYVQRLTLKQLLDLANVHLFKLNKRYSLKMEDAYKPKEELNFNLIDHYQTDQARLVDTSSGGEKFIISLALALGLSDLASKNVKIDSLFIDEGFGTLDKNTLETVISTLETLQSQGKMIGIISHVENLKERISTQIQITKKSNGVSTVEVVF